jgi:hypothetical protein
LFRQGFIFPVRAGKRHCNFMADFSFVVLWFNVSGQVKNQSKFPAIKFLLPIFEICVKSMQTALSIDVYSESRLNW